MNIKHKKNKVGFTFFVTNRTNQKLKFENFFPRIATFTSTWNEKLKYEKYKVRKYT